MPINKNIIAENYIKALKKSKKYSSEAVFIYTYEYNIQNFELLIDSLSDQFHSKILWSNQSKSNKILALGSTLSFDFNGHNKNQYNDMIFTIIKNTKTINNINQKNIPLFIGGQNFNIHKGNSNLWKGFPTCRYIIPEVLVYRENKSTTITNFFKIGRCTVDEIVDKIIFNHNQIESYKKNQSEYLNIDKNSREMLIVKEIFYNKVNTVKSIIKDSSISKIVLSNAIMYNISNDESYLKIISQLEKYYSNCNVFFYDFGEEGKFFGATPENIISKTKNTIYLDALAGSIEKGKTLQDEKINSIYLLENNKISKEHEIVIKGILESLDTINIQADLSSKMIMKLEHILHLKTVVTAKLSSEINPLHILDLLVPTPALSGYPKESAIEKLQELENYDRGWYSGALGWIDINMNYEFYAGLRSAFTKNNKIYIYAGAGIILDSDEKIEWNEILTKIKSIDDILNEK